MLIIYQKKYSSLENDKKRKFLNNNNNANKQDTISLQNEEGIIGSTQYNRDNESENNYVRRQIKVSKTKSSLKMPEEIISSTNNIKVIKKKTIKGKSESCLKKK